MNGGNGEMTPKTTNICFVAPLHSSRTRGYSLERYAFEIQMGLRRRGVEVLSIASSPWLGRIENSRVGRAIGMAYEGTQVLRQLRRSFLVHYADPVVGLTAMAAKSVPIVTTVHEVPDSLSHTHTLKLGLEILDRACRVSDLLIADSSVTREDLLNKLRIPSAKVKVVSLGVSPEFIPMEGAQRGEAKTIGYVGAFSPRKNVALLLEAYGLLCRAHPELKVQLELWGITGNHGVDIIVLANQLGLKNVHLRGFAEESALPRIYNSFDVFVFPSLKEGFGLPILEAKRCCVPTVLFRHGRIPDEVSRGSVFASSAAEMSSQLHAILTDPSYAREVARKGARWSKDFTWDNTAIGVLKAYRSLGYSSPGL